MFGRRRDETYYRSGTRRRWGRTNPNRRAAGLKAALHNPNTTHEGRREAKHELRAMGRGREAHGHPSLKSRIKRLLGIRSRPRNEYSHEYRRRERYY